MNRARLPRRLPMMMKMMKVNGNISPSVDGFAMSVPDFPDYTGVELEPEDNRNLWKSKAELIPELDLETGSSITQITSDVGDQGALYQEAESDTSHSGKPRNFQDSTLRQNDFAEADGGPLQQHKDSSLTSKSLSKMYSDEKDSPTHSNSNIKTAAGVEKQNHPNKGCDRQQSDDDLWNEEVEVKKASSAPNVKDHMPKRNEDNSWDPFTSADFTSNKQHIKQVSIKHPPNTPATAEIKQTEKGDWFVNSKGNEYCSGNSVKNPVDDAGNVLEVLDKTVQDPNENGKETASGNSPEMAEDKKQSASSSENNSADLEKLPEIVAGGKARSDLQGSPSARTDGKYSGKQHCHGSKPNEEIDPLTFQHPLPEEARPENKKWTKKLKPPTTGDEPQKNGNEKKDKVEDVTHPDIMAAGGELPHGESENQPTRMKTNNGGSKLNKNRKNVKGDKSLIFASLTDCVDGQTETKDKRYELPVSDYNRYWDNSPIKDSRNENTDKEARSDALFPFNIPQFNDRQWETPKYRNPQMPDDYFNEMYSLHKHARGSGGRSKFFSNLLKARREHGSEDNMGDQTKSKVMTLGDILHSNVMPKPKDTEDANPGTEEENRPKEQYHDDQIKDFWDILKESDDLSPLGSDTGNMGGLLGMLLKDTVPGGLPEPEGRTGANWKNSEDVRRELDKFLKQCRMNDKLYQSYGEEYRRKHRKHHRNAHHEHPMSESKDAFSTKASKVFSLCSVKKIPIAPFVSGRLAVSLPDLRVSGVGGKEFVTISRLSVDERGKRVGSGLGGVSFWMPVV
ncbi:hypothetical protein AAG570_009492 [Ranatra chinensis]|uniref:Uncharacterized protein n=1 Tax=Ranatra chinensis TaxID=642074 RepID=A0ABD0YPT3_9HEMI